MRERVAEKYRKNCDGGRDAHGAEQDLDIKRIFEEREVVVQIPVMEDDAVADDPEAVQEHEQVGKKQEECYPEDGGERYQEFVGAGIHQRPMTSGKGQCS